MAFNYIWDCNQIYPQALLNLLNQTIDLSDGTQIASISCYWVSDIYIPISSEELWSEVETNILAAGGTADDYYGPFNQGSGMPTQIGSTFTMNSTLLIDTDPDANNWGISWLEVDQASVFDGVEVPTLDPLAGGTFLKTLVFVVTVADTQYLLGTIMRDSGGSSLNVVPNGSPITMTWYNPQTYSPQTGEEPGIIFSFDTCDCSKSYPGGM